MALNVVNLSQQYGAFTVLDEVNLSVAAGQRHAIIGPNGAGKSTLMDAISGVKRPCAGQIWWQDQNLSDFVFHDRVRAGVVRTFQLNTLCLSLTPLEVLVLALGQREGLGRVWWRSLLGGHYSSLENEALRLLEQVGLQAQAHQETVQLAYGKQRLLEIALALAMQPKVLLLDEPAAGVPAGESEALFEVIVTLPSDTTVLFIEHDMRLVFEYAQRISVLVAGKILMEGTAAEVAENPLVREAYLGADFC